jgi:hypothetical protein
MAEIATIIPMAVVALLAVLMIIFVIKSLIKFAVTAAAIAALVFVAWKLGAFQFLGQYMPSMPWG